MFDNFILSKYSKGGKPEWQYHLLDHIVFELNPSRSFSFNFETKTYALSLQFELAAQYHLINTTQGIKPKAWRNECDRLVRKVQRFLTGSNFNNDSMIKPNIRGTDLHIVEQLLRVANTGSTDKYDMASWQRLAQYYMHLILNHTAGRRRKSLGDWTTQVEAMLFRMYEVPPCKIIFDEPLEVIW